MSVPHSQPAITVALERLLTGSPEWKPQLCASDIRFSADATGRRIVLGGGPFSTVSDSAEGMLGCHNLTLCWRSAGFEQQGGYQTDHCRGER